MRFHRPDHNTADGAPAIPHVLCSRFCILVYAGALQIRNVLTDRKPHCRHDQKEVRLFEKNRIAKMCHIVSPVLFACFPAKTIVDYTRYSDTLNSAPFYVWILANALYFIIPAILVFAVGLVMKKKS